ncbi:hypothetical protein BU17DRAFT_64040 [Hysterangium stoloniferum]|nr:hypothetical protein BU17DRAFT_64040 [Hysterangium stoloniferum]
MACFATSCSLIRSLSCFLIFSFALLVDGLDLNGVIQWNDICRGYRDIQGAKVILDNGRLSGSVRRNGGFTMQVASFSDISDVHSGVFVLSVISHDFLFDQVGSIQSSSRKDASAPLLRVDVSDAEHNVSVRAFSPGTPLAAAPVASIGYPIVLAARARNAYFVEREAFNPLAMFQSPMMLMMLATGVMLFATPYLMANMDKDTLDEVKQKQGELLAAQSSISNMDISSLKSLLGGDSENSPQSSKPTAQTTPSLGKGKTKARKRMKGIKEGVPKPLALSKIVKFSTWVEDD